MFIHSHFYSPSLCVRLGLPISLANHRVGKAPTYCLDLYLQQIQTYPNLPLPIEPIESNLACRCVCGL
uniref:Uncharacterized protein n=1 Tax=Arundo donax TaxID=35708 RepID=A0A0A8YFE0_ARUDO